MKQIWKKKHIPFYVYNIAYFRNFNKSSISSENFSVNFCASRDLKQTLLSMHVFAIQIT